MNGQYNTRVNQWMDSTIQGSINEWTVQYKGQSMNGQYNTRVNQWMDSTIQGSINEWTVQLGRSDIFQFYLHNGKFCNSVLHLKTAAVTMH
jgi:hypothetical protein